MGFVTGLLGGVTLTTSLLYLTLSIHQRNRLEQSLLLKQQTLLMRNMIEPLPPAPEPTEREARVSVFDSAKDMWNREIEGVVRKVQYTDWNEVREQMERGASRIWRRVRESVPAQEVEKQAERAKETVVAEANALTRGREG